MRFLKYTRRTLNEKRLENTDILYNIHIIIIIYTNIIFNMYDDKILNKHELRNILSQKLMFFKIIFIIIFFFLLSDLYNVPCIRFFYNIFHKYRVSKY